jgi:hypothetical protein
MATDLRNLPAFLADDATFRTWGGGISAQLAAVGLVQAADTGQINWATVARPAANGFAGYEIWRFSDSLQATFPVFIKLEYGTGSLADRPSLRVQTGSGTNGAGTLTGQVGIQRTPTAASKTAGIVLPSYCSGGPSRLNLVNNLDVAGSTFSMSIMIERTRNSAGAETSDGIVVFVNWSSQAGFQAIPKIGTLPGGIGANNSFAPANGGLSSIGAKIAMGPTVAFLGEAFYTTWCCYTHADLSELTSVPMTHLGAARTYMPMGDGIASGNMNISAAPGTSMAMLWE